MELSPSSDCYIKEEFNVRQIIDTIVVSDSEDDFLPKTPRTKRKVLCKHNNTSPKKLQLSQSIPSSVNPSVSCNSKVNVSKTFLKQNNKSKNSKNLLCTDFFAIKKHVIKEEKAEYLSQEIVNGSTISSISNVIKNEPSISLISGTGNLKINSVFNDLPSNVSEIDIVDKKIKLDISASPPENLTQTKTLLCEPKAFDIDKIKLDISEHTVLFKQSHIDNPTIKPLLCEPKPFKIKLDIPDQIDASLNQSHMCLSQLQPSQATQSKIPDYFQCNKSSTILTQVEEEIKVNDIVKQAKRYSADSNNKLLENGLNISNWTLKNDHRKKLFTEKELNLIKNLFIFSNKKCTILCLRLFLRIDKWYNLDHLCGELNLKDDDFNLQDLVEQLSADYLTSDYSNEKTDTLLNLLTSDDIKDICILYKIKSKRVKSEMIDKLLKFTSTQSTIGMRKTSCEILREKVIKKFGFCVKLNRVFKDVFYRIHLLYSLGNPELETISDIYTFLNRFHIDLVKISDVSYYENSKVFEHREDFLKYAKAYILRQDLYKHFEKKNICFMHAVGKKAHEELLDLLTDLQQIEIDKNKPVYIRRYSASWVYIKMLTFASQHLGKHYSDDVCEWLHCLINQDLYCLYKKGHWYIQLALIKDAHKKSFIEAANHILDGLSNKTISEVARHELIARGWKVKKHRVPQIIFDELRSMLTPFKPIPVERHITAQAVLGNAAGRKLQFVRETSEGREYSSVETTAINYYTTELNYSQGIHCEGQLFKTLFIVFFYDILFEIPVPNTFITEIQTYPLDLFSTEFFSNRFEYINDRLNNIKTNGNIESLCRYFSNTLREYSAKILHITNFVLDEDSFKIILKCIGQAVLAAVFERLATDYKQFHSGMPDLFLWNTETLKCAFVEVKSAKDKLSMKQILWIEYLHKFGANIEVCHVKNSGAKMK